MKIAVLRKNNAVLIERVELAVRPWQRIRGLLGRSSLGQGRALYLSPCGSVQTFFMKFDLDLVFLNRDMQVERIVIKVPPGRIVTGGIRSWGVLEMESGWFPKDALGVGDKVSLIETTAVIRQPDAL